MAYLLDTNIFITAKNELPMDVYPSFWNKMAQLATDGEFRSIKKVEEEIRKGKDELVEWLDASLPGGWFIAENGGTIEALSTVTRWVTMSQVYTPSAKNEFVAVADSWIVAEALSRSMTVVTHETPDPMCRRRVKIPDVCNAVGVRFCSLNEALRSLGVTI